MKQFTEKEIIIMLNVLDHVAYTQSIKTSLSKKLNLKNHVEENAYNIGFQDCIDIIKASLFPEKDND